MNITSSFDPMSEADSLEALAFAHEQGSEPSVFEQRLQHTCTQVKKEIKRISKLPASGQVMEEYGHLLDAMERVNEVAAKMLDLCGSADLANLCDDLNRLYDQETDNFNIRLTLGREKLDHIAVSRKTPWHGPVDFVKLFRNDADYASPRYWEGARRLFRSYTPEQIAPLTRSNSLEGVIWLHQEHPDLLQKLIDLKYSGIVTASTNAQIFNPVIWKLEEKIPAKDRFLLNVFLDDGQFKCNPMLEWCLSQIDEHPEPIVSFLARVSYLLSHHPYLSLDGEEYPVLLKRLNAISYFGNLDKAALSNIMEGKPVKKVTSGPAGDKKNKGGHPLIQKARLQGASEQFLFNANLTPELLLQIWLDSPEKRPDLEMLADRARMFDSATLSRCLDIYKNEGDSPSGLALRNLVKSVPDWGAIPVFLKHYQSNPRLVNLLARKGCDDHARVLLMLLARGNTSLIEHIEKRTLNDPYALRHLQRKNFALAEKLLKPSPVKKCASPRLQESLSRLDHYYYSPKTRPIFDLALKLSTMKDETEAAKALGMLAYAAAQNEEQTLENLKEAQSSGELLKGMTVPLDRLAAAKPDQLGDVLAELLLLPNGQINTDLIPHLCHDKKLKQGKHRQLLKLIQSCPEFSDRLSLVGKPCASMQPLVRMLLRLPEDTVVTATHARRAVLSCLLCPTRQYKSIGSCFSTSLLIQQESYVWGLRQKMEDVISLLDRGCLARTTKEGLTVEFPAYVNDLLNHPAMKEEHLLNRCLEYTTANFSIVLPHSSNLLKMHLSSLAKKLGLPCAQLESRFGMVYNACKNRRISDNDQGVWALTDKKTGSEVRDHLQFKHILLDIAGDDALIREYIHFRYPDEGVSEYYSLISFNYDWNLPCFGGSLQEVEATYFECQDSSEHYHYQPDSTRINLLTLSEWSRKLPEAVKSQAAANPEFATVFHFPRHTLCLFPEAVLKRIEGLKKEAADWLDLQLTEKQIEIVCKIFASRQKKLNLQVVDSPAPGITLRALFRAWNKQLKDGGLPLEKRKEYLNKVINRLYKTSFSPLPPLFIIADTNFDSFGFQPSFQGDWVEIKGDRLCVNFYQRHPGQWELPLQFYLSNPYNIIRSK